MEPSPTQGLGRRPAIAHPQRERAHARPAILKAARRRFKNDPYEMISIESIAADAGVTRHTVNNHFACKEEIFRESREQLLSELDERIDSEIPMAMEPFDGILWFLRSCHDILSDERNCEIVRSIAQDRNATHSWLRSAHQRRIRMRLVKNCETYILYKTSRADIPLHSPRMIAEHLVMLVEALVFGPYLNGKEKSSHVDAPSRHFATAAVTYAAMIDAGSIDVNRTPSKVVAAA